MRTSFAILLSLALPLSLSLVTGCDDEPDDADVETPTDGVEEPEAPIAPANAETQRLMAEHFIKANEARQALIGDDLDGARTAMAWLADNNPGGESLPDIVQGFLTQMRSNAGTFGDATTLTEASIAFAQTAQQCGECHAAVENGPSFTAPPMPEGDSLPAQMQRHAWAADRMWEGLITQDEALFERGTAILEEVNLGPEELPQGVLEPERVTALITHIQELGQEAESAEDWDTRANLYGRFIATCSTCHRAMGVGAFARQVMEEGTNEPTAAE